MSTGGHSRLTIRADDLDDSRRPRRARCQGTTLASNLEHDVGGLQHVDDLLTSDTLVAQRVDQLAHDIAFDLCDWLVVNEGLQRRLMQDGRAELRLNDRGDLADPIGPCAP